MRLAALSVALFALFAVDLSAREYPAMVARVIDGDTIVCKVDLGFGISLTEPVRIAGIDAPEKSTVAGSVVKRDLEVRLPSGTSVTLSTGSNERDKYGRIMGDLIIGGRSLAQDQIIKGHAKPYDGGKR